MDENQTPPIRPLMAPQGHAPGHAAGAASGEADPPHPEPLVIRDAEDVLGYIPHALGEWPCESLVAVTLCGGTLGATLRVDLPGPAAPGSTGPVPAFPESATAVSAASGSAVPRPHGADPRAAGLAQLARAVGEYVAGDRSVDAVVLAVYTDAPWPEPGRPPHADVVAAVEARLVRAGIPILDAWTVGSDHWRTSRCVDARCCPWPGKPTEALRTGRIGAEMVYRGSSYGAYTVPEARAGRIPPAAASAELDRYRDDPEAWWDPLAFTAAIAAWDEVLDGRVPAAGYRLRLLSLTLVRPALRDAVIVTAAAGAGLAWRGSRATAPLRMGPRPEVPPVLPGGADPATVLAAMDRWRGEAAQRTPIDPTGRDAGGPAGAGGGTPAEGVPARAEAVGNGGHPGAAQETTTTEYGLVLVGATGIAPDWERIGRLEHVCALLAQSEEPEVRAPALTLLAWVHWARGRGGRSLRCLERALMADPDYRLARLLKRLVEAGELSGWARSRETAWRRSAAA
ncbi:DUF4192 family protein [Sinomonas halotolerans]|uniref:DUF4192 family protein n=1 Tax=Sinomonas halotolerans TaxID=1644133 RepID=A0ABU9X2G6_9MICC